MLRSLFFNLSAEIITFHPESKYGENKSALFTYSFKGSSTASDGVASIPLLKAFK